MLITVDRPLIPLITTTDYVDYADGTDNAEDCGLHFYSTSLGFLLNLKFFKFCIVLNIFLNSFDF